MGTVLMDRAAMERAVTRIAYEILEKNKGLDNLVLIGIQRRGVVLAQEIAAKFKALEGVEVPVGILDITLYRDDLSMLNAHPVINGTDIEFDVTGKKIVLVDDVLYTGRTVRCAIDAIIELGRPQLIQLAIMIDRGHREFPFRADFVGKNVPTSKSEVIHVCVDAFDGDTCVILEDTEDKA